MKRDKLKTHEVLDLHYTIDECQGCFDGTYQECLDFMSTQTPNLMYQIVPMAKYEIENHPDNKELIEERNSLTNTQQKKHNKLWEGFNDGKV